VNEKRIGVRKHVVGAELYSGKERDKVMAKAQKYFWWSLA
jgi:hypothetical protein